MGQFTNKELEVIRTELHRTMDVIDALSGVTAWHLEDKELYDLYMAMNRYCIKIKHLKEEGIE